MRAAQDGKSSRTNSEEYRKAWMYQNLITTILKDSFYPWQVVSRPKNPRGGCGWGVRAWATYRIRQDKSPPTCSPESSIQNSFRNFPSSFSTSPKNLKRNLWKKRFGEASSLINFKIVSYDIQVRASSNVHYTKIPFWGLVRNNRKARTSILRFV